MSKNNGGPAFPWVTCGAEGYIGQGGANEGMTLRDYFAAAALPPILASTEWREKPGPKEWQDRMQKVAESAYAIADAMLAEREKPS